MALHVITLIAVAQIPRAANVNISSSAVLIRLPVALESTRETPSFDKPVAISETPTTDPPKSIITATPLPVSPPTDLHDEAELAAEREELRRQLDAETNISSFATPKLSVPTPSASSETRGRGPKGAVRELVFDGYPQSQIDAIMKKYKLRTTTQRISGRSNQHFLSSASSGDGDQYTARDQPQAGVYEVFLLSPEVLARMAQLEEEAIRARGGEPESTRVIKIQFGIKSTSDGPDLAVTEFDSEPIP